jgi:hypothetical protein
LRWLSASSLSARFAPAPSRSSFASGVGPDLFNQFSGLVAQYYNARVIAPIDFAAMGYADEAALTSQYMNGFDGARFGGRLYGIPTEVSNWVCYANNRIWKEAGLDPGHDFPTTWEALPTVAEKLTQRHANGVPLLVPMRARKKWMDRTGPAMTSERPMRHSRRALAFNVTAGLGPAIHVLCRCAREKRGWTAQGWP